MENVKWTVTEYGSVAVVEATTPVTLCVEWWSHQQEWAAFVYVGRRNRTTCVCLPGEVERHYYPNREAAKAAAVARLRAWLAEVQAGLAEVQAGLDGGG